MLRLCPTWVNQPSPASKMRMTIFPGTKVWRCLSCRSWDDIWCRPQNGIQVVGFGNCCLALVVEPRKSTSCTHCLENVLYDLGLHHGKQLYSLSKTDFYSTNITPDSTRNAPKGLDTPNKIQIYADDVYAISESSSSDRQNDKPNKSIPTNLTPVTIMVVDIISVIKSRKLLDSGSTTTLINNKCLPKHCKPCQISSL